MKPSEKPKPTQYWLLLSALEVRRLVKGEVSVRLQRIAKKALKSPLKYLF